MEAISHLNKAINYDPDLSHAYLLLGRALLSLGECDKAIESYRQYVRMRPKNPLGHLELGFTYEALGDFSSAVNEWQQFDFFTQDFIHTMEEAWQEESYEEILLWYKRAWLMNQLQPPRNSFRAAIAAVMTGSSLPHEFSPEVLPIYRLEDNLQIEAENLQWVLSDTYWEIDFGDRLIDHPSGDPLVGVMWWEKPAVAIVDVQQSGNYRVDVRVLHSINEPGELILEHNFTQLGRFSISPLWKEFSITIHLSSGLNILGTRYNQLVEGVDGDAILDWIRVQKKSDDNTEDMN
jgi:tetratricopeptide (TPR) repeat protein